MKTALNHEICLLRKNSSQTLILVNGAELSGEEFVKFFLKANTFKMRPEDLEYYILGHPLQVYYGSWFSPETVVIRFGGRQDSEYSTEYLHFLVHVADTLMNFNPLKDANQKLCH